ncbi:RagB/SusD family nutrient uptake outer membrane protein [Chitinophaga agrisoli]|nr:RagB/SusD family nutrient uptake outer membrane protein [Chitinophaga agrisoli]
MNAINIRYIKGALLLVCLCVLHSACTKLVEADAPVTSINGENVYNDNATAAAVLNSIYTAMSQKGITADGITALSLFPALSADELSLYGASTDPVYIAYYRNALTNINTGNTDFWKIIYPLVFTTNAAVEGLSAATGLTQAVKQQLSGEARFLRAFFYFYLLNLYGDVPLALSTDYSVNALLSRTPKDKVYQQIIADLKEAQSLLADTYVMADAITPYPPSSEERVRPNKWAATALLARVYLYTGDYVNAEKQATAVISNTGLYDIMPLNNTFLKESREAIWQLQPVRTGQNTQDARLFMLPDTGPNGLFPVYLGSHLLNSFEAGDQRRFGGNWIDSVNIGAATYYYPYKYKLSTTTAATILEYVMVLRLAEQYLIRAEARAQQNNIQGAGTDLDVIRHRAGLPGYNGAPEKNALLAAILHERQVELFTEWGHRWLDLKRTGMVDTRMHTITPQKGGAWKSTAQQYPIPASELQRGPNFIQNAGY